MPKLPRFRQFRKLSTDEKLDYAGNLLWEALKEKNTEEVMRTPRGGYPVTSDKTFHIANAVNSLKLAGVIKEK